jgi:hypothetical protein
MFDDDNVIAIEYAFTVAHASGETWPHTIKQTGVSTCRNSKGGWDDKSLNKCHTAVRKYFLLALFQIPTGEEDDADQGDRRPAPAQVPAVVHRVRSVAPEYVVPPPSCALKQGGIAERAIAQRYEQAVRSTGPSQAFLAKDAGKEFSPRFRAQAAGYDEANPPPHDTAPEGREAAMALNRRLHPMNDELPAHSAPPAVSAEPAKPAIDHTDIDGTPAFLRRKPNGDARTQEPSTSTWWEATDDAPHRRLAQRRSDESGPALQALHARRRRAIFESPRRRPRAGRDAGRHPVAATRPGRSGARPAMTTRRPTLVRGRLFFTVRHAIHSAMHPNQPAPHTVDWRTSGRR